MLSAFSWGCCCGVLVLPWAAWKAQVLITWSTRLLIRHTLLKWHSLITPSFFSNSFLDFFQASSCSLSCKNKQVGCCGSHSLFDWKWESKQCNQTSEIPLKHDVVLNNLNNPKRGLKQKERDVEGNVQCSYVWTSWQSPHNQEVIPSVCTFVEWVWCYVQAATAAWAVVGHILPSYGTREVLKTCRELVRRKDLAFKW